MSSTGLIQSFIIGSIATFLGILSSETLSPYPSSPPSPAPQSVIIVTSAGGYSGKEVANISVAVMLCTALVTWLLTGKKHDRTNNVQGKIDMCLAKPLVLFAAFHCLARGILLVRGSVSKVIYTILGSCIRAGALLYLTVAYWVQCFVHGSFSLYRNVFHALEGLGHWAIDFAVRVWLFTIHLFGGTLAQWKSGGGNGSGRDMFEFKSEEEKAAADTDEVDWELSFESEDTADANVEA
ncbi:hypothetical protein CERZMDRAFT_87858 [Cercospora zeae-maydis SCOH1-5]|uniref:Uncharacterized protein n=1 Tax=Cercospora zeae-maydis SCOH1-5 TaxID=717836 RepID=A0A6A6F7D1_9PEZI|nr:hypothetical protein CERZMDRAFT_87858 [Cercospora zeae-maydis SCOH1-5]